MQSGRGRECCTLCGCFEVKLLPKRALCVEHYPIPRIEDLFASLSRGQHFGKTELFTGLSPGACQWRFTEISHYHYTQRHVLLQLVTFQDNVCALNFPEDHGTSVTRTPQHPLLFGRYPGNRPRWRSSSEKLEGCTQTFRTIWIESSKEEVRVFRSSLEYLGHVTDSKGLHKSPDKICAILDATEPTNTSQLRSFLGH